MSKPTKIDRNLLCTRDIEFTFSERAADDESTGDGRTMEGYAAVFDTPTEINSWEGNFSERIAPGAFKKTLRERKPVLQFDHGRDSRVGSTPIGAFTELREDEQGLYCEARLFDNPIVEPVRQAIEAQAISGMSFKFAVKRDEWRDNAGKLVKPDELGRLLYEPGERGPLARTIKEVQLFEAGPVVFPAYSETSVGVRSMSEEDRTALVAEYARTAITEDATESSNEDDEERVNASTEEVEETETLETDAVREDTSETSEETDAALSGTSETSNTTQETERAKPAPELVPVPVNRKGQVKMTLAELKARLAEIEARQMELAEETRDASLTDEQTTEWDGLKTELTDVRSKIEGIEERASFLKTVVKADPKKTERGSDKGAPTVIVKQDDIYDLGELRSMAYSGDDFLAKVTDNAKRAIDNASYGVRGKEEAQERVSELLEDSDNEARDLAKRLLLTGAPEYARAFGKIMKHGSDAMCTNEERAALIRAQALGTDNAGGYAVPFQLDPTVILTNAGTVNPIRQLARVETIVGKQWQGVTSAGATVSRGAEAATAPDSSITLAQPVVSTNRVQGFVPFSIEIDLSWSALQREITAVLVDAKNREEDSFITGDGTGVNPEGIFGVATSDFTTATAATFVLADLYNYVASLPARWEDNASFLSHKSIYNLIRQFDTAGGAALWAHLGDGTPARLLDFPTYRTSASPSAVAASAKIALFGDFKQMLIVDRIGMSVELVPHLIDVAGGNNRPTGQRGVYAVWMNNSKVLVPSAFKRLVVHA